MDTVIALLYRKYERLTKSGNAKNVLNDESSGRNRRNRRSQDRNDRQYRVSQLVSREDLRRRDAFRSRRSNKVGAHDFQHR